MADNTVSFPDLALDKFSGNDPEQNVRSFLTTVENKINFSMGHEPDNDDERARYLFRKKALFSSLLRGPAAEWYTDNIEDGHDWQHIRTHFLTRFSDNRDKYRYRITAENSVRGNEEIVKNYFHRVKRAVDRGWPDEENADNAARAALNAQRRQKYIEFAVRGLTPNELKNKAHQYLIEHPNATWEQFQEHVTNKDLVFTISLQLAPNSSQNQKTLMNELREDINAMKNMLKEQQISSLAVANPLSYGCSPSHCHDYHISAVDVNNTSRQNITRFCKYCQRNGHTLQYCRKKIYDDEAKRAQSRANEEKKVTFTNDYNKRKGPGFGSQHNYQPSSRPNFTNNQRNNQQSNQNLIEADLTRETTEMITGTEITLNSRTTSTISIATTITLQVVGRLLLILICETILPILEIGQIARITSVPDHKTQIPSTIGISQPTITVSQTPYSSLTKKDRTESVQSHSTL